MAINLDRILNSQSTKKPIKKSTLNIDLEDVLLEWSYRLPKGYPTVINGAFPIQSEVDILNEILAEMGVDETVLAEARVFHHPDWSYIPNDRNTEEFTALGFDNEKLKQTPFIHVEELPQGGRYILLKGSSKMVEIDYEKAQQLITQPKTVILHSDVYSKEYLIVQGDVNALTQAKGDMATDTEVKEGLVVMFYYAQIGEMPNEDNVGDIISKLLQLVDRIPSESITDLTKVKLTNFLTVVQKVKPKKAAKLLTDFWSSSREILTGYKPNEYDAIRTGLFDRIRTLASKFTGLVPDKWCPGDIYLVKKSSLGDINAKLAQLENEMPDDGVGLLNSLFINDWGQGSKEEGLAAISLKAEKAQAGKAKQYLQLLSRKDLTYNVSKEEFDLDTQAILDQVKQYRAKIEDLTKTANVNVQLDQDSNPESMDEKRLREKFASLKLVNYLLGERGEDIDENLLGAVAFGMSLSGVNPTFWKVVGSSSGQASKIENPAGSTISLLDGGLDSEDSTITIRDKDSNNAVRFEMEVEKQGHRHLVWLNARSNGLTQATLEIVKDSVIS